MAMIIISRMPFLLFGLLFGLASLYPETMLCRVFCWISVFSLVCGIRLRGFRSSDLFIAGILFHVLAFNWLIQTIVEFGGFNRTLAGGLFVVFCLLSSLQFVVFGWLCRRLLRFSSVPLYWAVPLSWMTLELFWPRLFPWAIAHTQAGWLSFTGLAEFFGTAPLSALIFFVAVLALDLLWRENGGRFRILPRHIAGVIFFLSVLALGQLRTRALQSELRSLPSAAIGLIQGNLETEKKGDIAFFSANLERYQKISKFAESEGAELIIWPESVFIEWTPEDIERVRGTRFDPFPGSSTSLIYGGLSFREPDSSPAEEYSSQSRKPQAARRKYFNTAFGIDQSGSVVGRYHKKVLMPFGEYLPFAGMFPELKKLSPHTGDFTVGDRDEIFRFELPKWSALNTLNAGVLICYEDLIPRLSRSFVNAGAEVLVNLTNDAWYGRTAAPYQHHLLALWRSIETRRFLLRVTNTGYTAVVSPLGETMRSLPLFTEGFVIAKVKVPKTRSLYLRVGDVPAMVLGGLLILLALLPKLHKEGR